MATNRGVHRGHHGRFGRREMPMRRPTRMMTPSTSAQDSWRSASGTSWRFAWRQVAPCFAPHQPPPHHGQRNAPAPGHDARQKQLEMDTKPPPEIHETDGRGMTGAMMPAEAISPPGAPCRARPPPSWATAARQCRCIGHRGARQRRHDHLPCGHIAQAVFDVALPASAN